MLIGSPGRLPIFIYICEMTKKTLFKRIISKHKLGISITYSLFALEICGSLIKPLLLGNAIDDLISGHYKGLITLCVIQVIWALISVLRQRMDTRVYTKIYTSLVTTFLIRNFKTEDVSKLSARSTLAQEIVNFFEYDLGYVFSAGASLIGSVVMIYFYNSYVFGVCLLLFIPIILISYFFSKRIKFLNKSYNDEYEKQIDIISLGEKEPVNEHYNKMRNWQIRLSDQEAFNFGYLELLSIILVALTLLIVKTTSETIVTTGTIVGIYNYILKFIGGLESIPHLLQRMTNLNDILGRLNIEEEDILSS